MLNFLFLVYLFLSSDCVHNLEPYLELLSNHFQTLYHYLAFLLSSQCTDRGALQYSPQIIDDLAIQESMLNLSIKDQRLQNLCTKNHHRFLLVGWFDCGEIDSPSRKVNFTDTFYINNKFNGNKNQMLRML